MFAADDVSFGWRFKKPRCVLLTARGDEADLDSRCVIPVRAGRWN